MKQHNIILFALLAAVAWLSGSTVAKKAAADSDESKSAEVTEAPPPDKIYQCECGELQSCHEDRRAQLRPCVDECAAKLTHPDWDAAAGRKCFTDRGKQKPPTCFTELHKLTCASKPGVLLDRNETFAAGGGKKKSSHNDGDTQRRAEMRNSRKKYRHFLRDTFKESGRQYRKCVRACHKKVGGFGGCQKKLKCASKRLDAERWKEERDKCAAKRTERHNTFCDCLESAGIKKPQCHVDEDNHDADRNEVN